MGPENGITGQWMLLVTVNRPPSFFSAVNETILFLEHPCRVSLGHESDWDARDFFHRLDVDCGNVIRYGIGHVSRLAVGSQREPGRAHPAEFRRSHALQV